VRWRSRCWQTALYPADLSAEDELEDGDIEVEIVSDDSF
jgi:hypothetical protein